MVLQHLTHCLNCSWICSLHTRVLENQKLRIGMVLMDVFSKSATVRPVNSNDF